MALWCWYRGAAFHGYQGQRGLRTVQGELLRAYAAAGVARNPVVAGRTDRGVSARMQVLSGRLERGVEPAALLARLSAHLPPDLGLHLAAPADPGFHAAWSATWREYRYLLPAALAGERARLEEAATLVPGTRDFRVFHFKTSPLRPRTVSAAQVLEGPEGLELRLVGDAFARHMVRMLVGGLGAVARGEVALDTFRAGLTAQRPFHCPVAPPEPLTLWSVGYPPALDPFGEAERAAFAWPPGPWQERRLTP